MPLHKINQKLVGKPDFKITHYVVFFMMPVGRERKDSIYDILTPHKTDYFTTIIVTGSSLNKL